MKNILFYLSMTGWPRLGISIAKKGSIIILYLKFYRQS